MSDSPDVTAFFYGSFMNTAVLRDRGVQPRRVRAARLTGWALVFQPMANVVPAHGDEVHGMVTTVDRKALAAAYHGHPLDTYYSEVVEVEVADGSVETVECYLAPPSEPAAPSAEYMKLLTDAAAEHGLPTAWIERLKRVRHS